MSAMKELYLKVAADESLQAKVNKIFEAAGEDADVAGKKLVEFAGEQGYTITVKELGEFFQAMSEAPDAELSEEELDAVAGGKVAGWIPTNLSAIHPGTCLVYPGKVTI